MSTSDRDATIADVVDRARVDLSQPTGLPPFRGTPGLITDDTRNRLARGDLWNDDGARLLAIIDAAEREHARLRDIIVGRTVAPTDAEIALHHARRGRWLISHDHSGDILAYVLDAGCSDGQIEARTKRHGVVRWVALAPADDGRQVPCAWPTVTP